VLELRIAHLYPRELNLYGDRGNLLALADRVRRRGGEVRVVAVGPGDPFRAGEVDLVFIGGGQDREQRWIAEDLLRQKGRELVAAVRDGMPLLAVCGGYQLLGRYYRTQTGEKIPGVGLFDAWTEAGRQRLIGDVALETDLWDEGRRTLVGFENHAGRTWLGPSARPLGRVLRGHGNNGRDRAEGVHWLNAVGTYLHGALLPKNPRLGDWLILAAWRRKYGLARLEPLDDGWEWTAHRAALRRLGLAAG
jgi:CobQ-like glutamine amidotransferase family enzyme